MTVDLDADGTALRPSPPLDFATWLAGAALVFAGERATGMNTRSTVDTIIQGAVVDLFHSLDIASAPLAPASGQPLRELPDLAAFVHFNAAAGSGVLCLGCPISVVQLAEKAAYTALAKEDWIRELMNQLMGRVKKRFLQFGVPLNASLPSPASKQFLDRHGASPHCKIYSFRTIRGSVIVVLDAQIEDRQFSYCGAVQLRDEGDIILF